MGDGNLTTTAELLPLCNLPDAEVCAADTQLAGILVNNTDVTSNGLEAACNPFEICPADTVLTGVTVLDDGDPSTIPDVCELDTLGGTLQNCIAYYLSLGNGAARADAIQTMINTWVSSSKRLLLMLLIMSKHIHSWKNWTKRTELTIT